MSYVAVNGRPLRAKEGDTVTFSFQLQDHNRQPVDITNSTVRVAVGNKKQMLINKEVTKVNAAQGLISFSIGTGEFLTKGFYDVEFIATHADTTTETFPTKNHLGLEVEGSIENLEGSTQTRSSLTVLISETQAAKSDAESLIVTLDGKLGETNTAISNANTATTNANTAASDANTAATNANTAASSADTATTNANTATTNANNAATSANTAATNANDKAAAADTAATNANNAATSANNAASSVDTALANNVHVGEYSGTVQYYKNNAVRYNGSTYRAIQDTLGNLPTNTLYWELEALKGADGADGLNGADGKDGTGTVNSVNSQLPDGAGNVVLTPANIGAATSDHTHTLNALSDVDVATPSEGQVLTLVNGVWVASTTSSAVSSVNGKTGAVTITYTDVDAAAATHGHADATTTASGFMSTADKTKLDGVEANANNYDHPSGDGNLHVPATGTTNNANVLRAGSTAGSLTWGKVSYTELTNVPTTFTPSAHTHAISEVTNLQTALDGKASTTHSHAISDVTNLQTTLDGKSNTGHAHAISDVTNLQLTLDGKASTSHSHAISDVTNLQTTLDGKASTTHSHSLNDLTDVDTATVAPTEGQVLKYLSGAWKPSTDLEGTGGGGTGSGVEYVSVTDHGAVGDGTTNDAPAFQAAIDAVNTSGGGIVYVPNPSNAYLLNTALTLKDNVKLKGDGGARGEGGAKLVAGHDGVMISDALNASTAIEGLHFVGRTSPSVSTVNAIKIQAGCRISSCYFDFFKGSAVWLTSTSVASTVTDVLCINSVYDRTVTVKTGGIHVEGTDNYVSDVEANVGSGQQAAVSANGNAVGLYIGGSNHFVTDCIGEFAEIGIYVGGDNHRIKGSRADRCMGHGFIVEGSGSLFTGCHTMEIGTAADNTYDAFQVSGALNTFIGCFYANQGTHVARYGFNDTVSSNSLKNEYFGCSVDGLVGTAKFINNSFLGSGFNFGKAWYRYSDAATVDVSGRTSINLDFINPTTLTGFTGGVNSQIIHVIGTPSTTIQNSASLKTNTGTDKVLQGGVVYTFINFNGEWYEMDGNSIASSATLPFAHSALRGKTIRVEGAAGVKDKVYICVKWADDTYGWMEISDIPAAHSHAISDVTNLQTTLDGKAAASHAHAISDVTNLQTTLDGKSNTGHGHAISDVTNLQTTLDGKAASTHGHAISDVTNLQTTLDGKSNTSHTHTLDALSDVSTAGATTNSVVKHNGTSWVASNESTMETRTTDPTSPAVGRFWLRTDL